MQVDIKRLEKILMLYERCLKERWLPSEIVLNGLGGGLCALFIDNNMSGLAVLLGKELSATNDRTWLAPAGRYSWRSHEERFMPRIVFLRTLIDELKKL